MPYYEYLCDEGHTFETEQNITASPLKACTHVITDSKMIVSVCCSPCRRQLCKSSFVLKGGGWSGDGYAKSGKGETT